MKSKNKKKVLVADIFLILLAAVISISIAPKPATAKSLYVIADILGSSENRTQPVQAYDIGIDGTLTFQAQHDIPHSMLGAVGMAIDADNGYVFITYQATGDIQLLEATTMADAGKTRAPDASDLAGIVYDHDKGLLYTVDRGNSRLYVYNWWPETATLTHVPGSPFTLRNASAYGIALDENEDLLYVANGSNSVTVYSTSDWALVDTITLSRIAISIAVDVKNGFVYTGGGYAGNMYLTQYHLATGTEKEVQVEPDAGVMGLAVETDTGLVYLNTGSNNAPGGDNLLVYDKALNQIDIVVAIGNPTGLAIPSRDIGYNPLNLSKQVLRGAAVSTSDDEMTKVSPGDTFTYGIYFDNTNNYTVTDVTIVDILPREVSFVTADDDGINGFYDYDEHTKTQTYTWTYKELPPRTSTLLEITVQVNSNVNAGRIITNSVTINTNETPPTTTSVDVLTTTNDLNLKKTILGIPAGQVTQVNSNDIITYIIEFDNKDNDFAVTNVSVVDELPRNVTFISAVDGKGIGRYDDKSHTYTWTFDSLGPGEVVHLEIVVTVNPNLEVGTVITNIVSIDSDETPKSAASVDAITYYRPLNIVKKAVDMSDSEIEWAEPGERFTYQICFDNNDNDSKVTDVIIVDYLPGEVTFIASNDGRAAGKYDPKSHSFTWSYGSLDPGLTDCLELVVDLRQDTTSGTLITNSVIIDCNETLPSTAEHDLLVGETLLRIDNLSIIPNVLTRNDMSTSITATLEFPEGINKSDIDLNYQPELYYQGLNTEEFIFIEKGSIDLSGTENKPIMNISFDRNKLMDVVYGSGEFELIITGKFKSGQSYYGHATINIIQDEDGSDHVSINEIYMAQIWDYGDPSDDNDLTFEFRLGIILVDYGSSYIEPNITSIEFLTPAGNTFHIPKQPEQSSGTIWTSYKYEGGLVTCEYRARFTDIADLQAYGDGEYTIIVNYTDSGKSQTTVLFGILDTNDQIPQPTQEPALTFPLHNKKAESPVTFTWEPRTDANVTNILIEIIDQENNMFHEQYVDVNETSWGPISLTEGIWEIAINFEQDMGSYINDGIWISTAKQSKSKCEFTILDYPYTRYEVWGGDTYLSGDSFSSSYWFVHELEANGYVKLGKSDGQTTAFQGEYQYYIIPTRWQFQIDSIQGSDGSYLFSEDITHRNAANITDPNNIFGTPDGLCATIGKEPWYGDTFSGYFVFNNPSNWKGLTVITRNLNISKSVMSPLEELEDISPNDTVTYRICFDSNDLTQDITDVTVVDILPDDVSFVSADSKDVSGTYDPDKHTYTWSYLSLAPESSIETQLTVQVNPEVVPGTTITNFVTINSDQTPPLTASVDVKINEPVIEIPPPKNVNLSIIPNVLRRNSTSQYITAVVQFPEGTNQNDIDLNNQAELYYQDQLIGKGGSPVLSGTYDGPTITVYFSRPELMNKLYGYGEFKLRIEGKLGSGQSYSGEGIIYITRFAGD